MTGLKAALQDYALGAGFVKMGVCRPDAVAEAGARMDTFLGEGRQGQMHWMTEKRAWRRDPRALWPEARSVVMLAESYTPGHDPLDDLKLHDRGAVSVYAQGRDYHDVVKKRLKQVGRWFLETVEKGGYRDAGGKWVPLSADAVHPPAAHAAEALRRPEIKVFVDTAPVMEKPLAAAAGLGWQGKHTNLLGRGIGNWVFLGAIFLAADLPPDAPEGEHCGSCRRCLDICPTNAFPAPFQLDARRCISYLTIELKGPIPRDLRPLIGNRIYGCDDCLAVCPWNKFAAEANTLYQSRVELNRPRLADFAGLDDAAFREVFRGSPIKRIGRARFLRNVMVAVGNSGLAEMIPVAEARLDDPDPLVRGHAVWALSRLSPPRLRARAEGRAPDPDAFVEEEWRLALA